MDSSTSDEDPEQRHAEGEDSRGPGQAQEPKPKEQKMEKAKPGASVYSAVASFLHDVQGFAAEQEWDPAVWDYEPCKGADDDPKEHTAGDAVEASDPGSGADWEGEGSDRGSSSCESVSCSPSQVDEKEF